jgi:hypothetical protein
MIEMTDYFGSVMSTIIVPASDTSKQYAAEQPVKAVCVKAAWPD